MKICHLNYHANSGGGAIAAMRLHMALKQQGVDSVFLAVETEGNPDAIGIATKFERKKLLWKQRLLWRIYQLQQSKNKSAHSFDVFSSGFVARILAYKPDIVHLHIVNGEMLSIKEIGELSRKVKVVWTLHDCWPFCGTEQHPLPNGNDRYVHGYTKENKEDSGIDFDRFFWNMKKNMWGSKDFHFIAPSHWIGEMLKNSNIFSDTDMRVIGNTIDTTIFSMPSEKQIIRNKLGLPKNKFLIAFGASNLDDDNKGGKELAYLLERLAIELYDKIELVTVGKGTIRSPLKNNMLGYMKDQKSMASFYQACDLFLLPSKNDNLPNMILESMACGTPVAAFAVGGIPDLISNDTGLLAPAFDAEILAEQICAYINDKDKNSIGSVACRYIEDNYSFQTIAQKHIKYYENIL